MKKRIISLILSICMFVSLIPIFSVSSSAEDSRYNELMAQKKEYWSKRYSYYPVGDLHFAGYGDHIEDTHFITPDLTVLLYTDVGKRLTLEKQSGYSFGAPRPYFFSFVDQFGDTRYITSPELSAIVEPSLLPVSGGRREETRSTLRDCIKYFGITKEELLEAFKTMKEKPDAIRHRLRFLTDKEYESAKRNDGTFAKTDWPEFVIEAMFIEDDKKAHDLINMFFAVYVPELGRSITYNELEMSSMDSNKFPSTTFDKLLTFDLTSDVMGDFIQFILRTIAGIERYDVEGGYFNPERRENLKKERARQLAVQTGEELIFIPLAVISLAGAVAIVNPKLRWKFRKAD